MVLAIPGSVPHLTIAEISKQGCSEAQASTEGHGFRAGAIANKPGDLQITYVLWASVPHQQEWSWTTIGNLTL